MLYDMRKLAGEEVEEFKRLLEKYKGYDYIDLIIHKTLKSLGISHYEFQCRTIKESNKKQTRVTQQEGNILNAFCDSEKCQLL